MVFDFKSTQCAWKAGSCIKADAQKAAEMFEEIRQKDGLSPQTLLDANREPGTLLHDEYEWDDQEAAEKYRLNQSGHIIRSLVFIPVETQEDNRPVKHYAAVRAYLPVGENKGQYEHIRVIAEDTAMRKRMLDNCLAELKSFQRKYSTLKDVVDSINQPISLIENYLNELETKEGA